MLKKSNKGSLLLLLKKRQGKTRIVLIITSIKYEFKNLVVLQRINIFSTHLLCYFNSFL